MGGGTLDVSLLSFKDGVTQVIANSGDTHLGGEDFDQRITEYIVQILKEKHNIDFMSNKRALYKLK